MRLKINLNCNKLKLPINYQSIIQGLIYSTFDAEYGEFIHNEGFTSENKKFKLFVFSNIFGQYTIEDNMIIFDKDIHFYISSHNGDFIEKLYNFLCANKYLLLNKQRVYVKSIKIENLNYFRDIKDINIKTISPVVAFTTDNKYVNYFKPSDDMFKELCLNNIESKNHSLGNILDNIVFDIKSVSYEKKRIVRFKNTFYIAYDTKMTISTNFETLELIYNTGLSAKGSAGFGCIMVDD